MVESQILIFLGGKFDLFMSMKDHLPYTEFHLIEVHEVELPNSMDIISRLTWYARLDQRRVKNPYFKCCQDTDWLQWFDAKDIAEQKASVIEYLWSNELLVMSCSVATSYSGGQTPFSTFTEYR